MDKMSAKKAAVQQKSDVADVKKDNQPTTTEPTPQAPTPTAQPEQATEVKPMAAEAVTSITKQQQSIMALVVALREQRNVNVTPEMLVQDGKFINFVLGEAWPVIAIGPSGGMNLPGIKSYPKSDLATMLQADALLTKQLARETKKAAATAPAQAAKTPTAKAPENTT